MKGQIQNRILAFFLAMVMLCTSAPFPAISVEPEEPVQNVEQEGTATSVYSKYVGSLAEISFDFYSYLVISDDPSIAVQDGQELVATDMTDPLVLEIVDYYWDEESCALWYKVKAAPGCTLPEKLQQYPWAFQNYTDVYEEEDWESYSPDSLIIHENMEIPTLSSDTGVTVSAFNLPEGATLTVKAPEIDGKPLPGMYDIKIIVDGEEWQPIDYGTSVRISIPVEGVEDGEYVDVYHFLENKSAIEQNDDVEYISTEPATEKELTIFAEAINASDREGYIARVVAEKVEVSNGIASVATNSFSVFYYDNGAYGDSDGNASSGGTPNPINFDAYNVDNGKTYFVTRGTLIYCYNAKPSDVSITCDKTPTAVTYSHSQTYGEWYNKKTAYVYKVEDNAPMYSKTTLFKNNPVVEDVSIYFVVMPTLTVKFETHLTNWQSFITLPPDITTGIFMGNCPADQHDPAKGKYGALNYTLGTPTIAEGVTGYTFNGWYVKHAPEQTFAGGQAISLSNETLQVKWDENTESYEVTLVADFSVAPHKITYVYNDGVTPDKTITYQYENLITIEDPTRVGYNFLYWEIDTTNIDPVEDWRAQFTTDQVPGGSTVTNMYGDVTLKAVWEASGNTPYTVRHMYESLTNPGTYEFTGETTTQYGTTGGQTNAELAKKPVAGFYVDETDPNCYINTTIAADGSTVAEVRYKRAELTITFVDPQNNQELGKSTGLYGAAVTGVPTPTKDNYVFMGWYTADYPDQDYIPTTYPATNLTLYAQWNIKKATITFIDPLNNNSILHVINDKAETKVDAPADPTKDGYEFDGWYTDTTYANMFSFPYTLKGDDNIMLYAKWIANKYTITFDTDGGTEIAPITQDYGSAVTAPADPTKEGYTFGGWVDADGNTVTFPTTMPAENITLYAKWTVKQYQVVISCDTPGAVEVSGAGIYAYGTSAPICIKPVDGYRIKSITRNGVVWGTANQDGTPNNESVKENLTIVITVEAIPYTITYNLAGGTVAGSNPGSYTVESGEITLINPTRTGYTFAGWTGTGLDDATMEVTIPAGSIGNRVYTATWTIKSYTVTWIVDGNTTTETYEYGAAIVMPETPQKTGYTFAGWSGDVPGTMPAYNLSFTALWTPNTNTPYVVKHYQQNIADDNYTLAETENLAGTTDTEVTPAVKPYTGFTAPITQTVTIQADGSTIVEYYYDRELYTIVWENEDGTVLETDSNVKYGATPVYNGATPTKADDPQYRYTFAGWDPAIAEVTGEATYTATYTKTERAYTVTYERGFGLGSTTQEYLWGTTVTIDVVDPAYTGFAFLGWQCDIAGCACAEGVYHQLGYAFTMPAADVVLTAKWDPKPYTLTYNGEGVMQTQEFYAAGKTVVVAAAPIRDGYKFTGWKDEVTGTVYQPGDEFTMPAADMTLTAQWTVKTYTITFVDWNGNVLQTAQVQYGIMPAAPANPSRPRTMDYSYEFTGWSPAVVNVTGDQTYTATYKARQHYVYIGINYSYHMSTYQYTYPSDGHSKQNAYHQFPNEPRELWMEAMRAAYQSDGSWSLYPADNSGQLTGLPSEFINETLLKQHAVTTNSAYGVFDSTGDLVKACFQFSADDATNTQMYEALIKAWLKQGILGGTDIYWDKVPPENCKVIPYVVKQQGSGNWYVDMVIVVDETSLTIEAPKVEGSDGQIFLFEITATDHPGFGFVVAVSEGKSVVINGLFPGKEYIVKELTGWSWRSTKTPTWAYTTDENPNYSGILPNLDTSGEGDTATFTLGTTSNKLVVSNTWADTDWLGDEAYLDNKFPPYVEITP